MTQMIGVDHQSGRVCLFGLISKHAGRNLGGTALSIRRLANFLRRRGLQVDILMRVQKEHFLFDDLDEGVVVRQLNIDSKPGLFLALLRYTLAAQPEVVLSFDTRASLVASWLARVPGHRARIWCSFRSELNRDHAPALKRIARRSHGIIAISHGLAEDFHNLTGSPPHQVHVLHNLAVSADIAGLAQVPVNHPWLQGNQHPVICGIGRLVAEKGFEYLIDALPAVREVYPNVKLIIVGQGPLLNRLRQTAADLHLLDSIDFTGFQRNPWAYLARADVFVLPSLAEAFGNVLAEALSLGVPVVASDCPHGPRDILENGRYGRLVPPADSHSLAAAVLATLKAPLPAEQLIEGAQRFREETAGQKYLDLLGLN